MRQAIFKYQVLHGVISHLSTEQTHVHYLKNIKHHQEMAGGVAILQSVLGQAGAINSVQAATCEGDPVEGFVMQVDGKAVRGSFWKTTFTEGDRVQVVGQQEGGVFRAVAVIKPDERIIWMQPHCERGTQSQVRNLFKCSGWFVLFMCLCASLISIFSDWPAWLAFASFSIATIVTLFATVGMSWGDFMSFASEMNAVGNALGLPKSEEIDLFKSTKQARKNGRPDLPLGVYYF